MISWPKVTRVPRQAHEEDTERCMGEVRLEHVRKVYNNGHVAVAGADFHAATFPARIKNQRGGD